MIIIFIPSIIMLSNLAYMSVGSKIDRSNAISDFLTNHKDSSIDYLF